MAPESSGIKSNPPLWALVYKAVPVEDEGVDLENDAYHYLEPVLLRLI